MKLFGLLFLLATTAMANNQMENLDRQASQELYNKLNVRIKVERTQHNSVLRIKEVSGVYCVSEMKYGQAGNLRTKVDCRIQAYLSENQLEVFYNSINELEQNQLSNRPGGTSYSWKTVTGSLKIVKATTGSYLGGNTIELTRNPIPAALPFPDVNPFPGQKMRTVKTTGREAKKIWRSLNVVETQVYGNGPIGGNHLGLRKTQKQVGSLTCTKTPGPQTYGNGPGNGRARIECQMTGVVKRPNGPVFPY
ncbi:MAG: hypothetical protein HN509_09295 [Halobacteriovoraceae bacterium]|jgi:hypothetical protein|nr:hypothetical protein [Halobacteriovoraceae bacterium]MBT5093049.1 hypothetical protein [Halobacteriovoraceae bacterium]